MTAHPPNSPLSSQPILGFLGPLGTGKTEIAISYSLASLAAGRPTCLIDFDVVTPYFRVGNYRDQLASRGLHVIAAPGSLAGFETPALSPEIAGALHDPDLHVVLDISGDPEGARLLGTYAPAFPPAVPTSTSSPTLSVPMSPPATSSSSAASSKTPPASPSPASSPTPTSAPSPTAPISPPAWKP